MGVDFSGGRNGGDASGNVVLSRQPPEAVGMDDAWSQGSWSVDGGNKSRFNKKVTVPPSPPQSIVLMVYTLI